MRAGGDQRNDERDAERKELHAYAVCEPSPEDELGCEEGDDAEKHHVWSIFDETHDPRSLWRANDLQGMKLRFFPTLFVATALVKLWLTSPIRTVPLLGPHDPTNFLDHAASILAGAWFGPYSLLTLIKGPFFPLYLALIQQFGLSVNLAHQLTYLGACLVAYLALAPILPNRIARVVLWFALLFNPMTYDSWSWMLYRMQVSVTLSLLVVACAAALYVRRRAPVRARLGWSIGLGLSLAAFWLTREEGAWILPFLATIAIASIVFSWRTPERESQALVAIAPAAIWVGAVALVQAINLHVYGWAVTSELQSREFISAYASLARIAHRADDPHVPVPKSAREIAYRISPLAKLLEPSLDGPSASRWIDPGCRQGYGCKDIAGGWWVWAFRDGVFSAGFYDSAPRARAFYVALAKEIDGACDNHTIECTQKRYSLAPDLNGSYGEIARHFVRGTSVFLAFGGFSQGAWDLSPPPPGTVREYAYVTRDVNPIGPADRAADDNAKRAILSGIESTYRVLFPIALLAAVVMIVVRLGIFVRRRVAIHDSLVLALGVYASSIALLVILAIIDALSFVGFIDEYFGSLYGVLFFALVPVISAEIGALARWFAARSRSANIGARAPS